MRLKRASDISPTKINWFWPWRIPKNAVTILEGDPGVSKSTLTCFMAATVSRGWDWPDGEHCEPGKAIICNAEDPEDSIIVPRLMAIGADCTQIEIITEEDDSERTFTIPDDIAGLESLVRNENIQYLVIDPLTEYLSPKVNHLSDHSIRQALKPVSRFARRCECTVMIVRHLNKDTTKPMKYRGGGSIGITGAGRSSILVSEDPTEKGAFVMALDKYNWSAQGTALGYKVEVVEVLPGITATKIVFTGERLVSAKDVMALQVEPNAGEIEDVAAYIRVLLKDGPRGGGEVIKAVKEKGYNKNAIYRAKKLMALTDVWDRDVGDWVWGLPVPLSFTLEGTE